MDDILKSAWGDLLNENEKLAALLDEKGAEIERLQAAATYAREQTENALNKLSERNREIKRLEAAFDAFSKAISVSGGPSLTMQRHDQTWEAWKTLCNAFAALAGKEG